jgi:hypothetical protein
MLQFSARARDFYLLQTVQTGSGGSSSVLFNGYRGSLPGGKAAGREAEQTLLSISRVKMNGSAVQFHPTYNFTVCTGKFGLLGTSGKQVRIEINSFIMSVCTSVCLEQLGFH